MFVNEQLLVFQVFKFLFQVFFFRNQSLKIFWASAMAAFSSACFLKLDNTGILGQQQIPKEENWTRYPL